MTKKPVAHRADFSVRCACGMVYNTDDSHIGKQIRCRCGKAVAVVRPADEYVATEPIVQTMPGWKSTGRTSTDGASTRSGRSDSRRDSRSQSRTASRAESRVPAWPARIAVAVRERISAIASWFRRELRSQRRTKRWVARAGWAWTALAVVSWLLLIFTSESFLPATLLAYGPRFVLLLPFLLFVPLAAIFARRTLIPLSLGLLVVVYSIMGGRVSLHSLGKSVPAGGADSTVRVLTYNVEGGQAVVSTIRQYLEQTRPDIVALQECGDQMWDTVQALPYSYRLRFHGLCTASRWPIRVADSMPRATYDRIAQYGFGGTGLVMRHLIQSPYGSLVFVNLHLTTARRGLELLMGRDGFVPDIMVNDRVDKDVESAQRAEIIDLNARIRNSESERASMWAMRGQANAPVLVAGDFNLPVESTIFRHYWNAFTDAFESSGTGFGWSKEEGRLLRIRNDHVLVGRGGPRPVGTWVGADLGSDHLPVIADFKFRAN